jgi:diguanylate cyclase (GGDEF)-like protein/PAS domain S-box-containing protein
MNCAMYSLSVKEESSNQPHGFLVGWFKTARYLPWLVLLISLTVTYHLWQSQRDETIQRLQDDFDFRVREIAERLEQRLIAYEQVLRGAQGLFAASDKVERDKFHTYVAMQRLGENYPGIQGIGFSLIVPPAVKEKHIAAIRKGIHIEGIPAYTIKPEGERSFYTSIIYLEPFSGRNLRAFGYDMYSEPVRRSAMEQARDSGKASISGKVRLIQETENDVQAGFLMYLPIYKNGISHDTVTERQANIIGWVYAPFRMNDLIHSIQNERSGELDYEIFDGAELSDKTLMYDSDNVTGSTRSARFQGSKSIDIDGHLWSLMVGSYPTFDARLDTHRASLIAQDGVVVSLLLALLTWLLVSGRSRALAFAREMNHELIQSEAALQESESRLRVIVESQLVCIVTVKNRIIQWANPAFEKLLGYEKGELNGVPARQIFVNDDAYQALGENAYPVINSGKVFRTELEYLRKDGSHITTVVSGGMLNLETGESLWTCVDITERKLLEMQHRRLSTILMQSNEPVTLVDLDGRYVYANPAFCKLFGYELDELLGKHISLLMPLDEDSGLTIQQTIASTKEHGEFHGEVKRCTKNGIIIPLLLRVTLFQEHGEQVGYVATMIDLTEIKRIENQLRDNAVLSQTILNSVSEGLHGLNRDGEIIFENPAATSMFGWGMNEMIGQPAHKMIHHTRTDGSPYPQSECHIYATLNDGVSRHILDEVFWRKNSTSFPVDYTSTAMRNAAGEIIGTLVSFSDITERKRAEESLRITASVFDNSQEAIVITDPDNTIIDVNPAFTQITGYSHDEVIGKNPKLLSSGRQNEAFYNKMWKALKQNRAWRGEIWNRRKSGEIYAELLSISAIVDNNDKVLRYVAVFSDISHIKEHEAELSHVAHFDALTRIPNRVLLADRMKQAIAQTSREQNMMAVCYLDLDGFKPINDAMGHDSGDQVLIEVARRIENTIRGGDTVARLGGDEFVVLLLGLEQGEECVTTLERLLAAIAQPISVKDKLTKVSASIGVSIYPLDDEDPDTLLRHADQAMYVAKQSGKNRFHIYDPEMDRRARDQNEFLKSIRYAMEHDQFELHYQPKVLLRTRELVGAEALIRWRHPERGLLPPAEFLRHIENTDLDIEIGEWVTATALAQMNYWRSTGLDIEISINISGYHMESSGFVEKLKQQITRYPDMLQGKLQIEVLETVALKDIAIVRGLIESCRKLGVGFALDDFGTGYSSLSYLSSLPVDALKIDQSFVRDMLEDKGDMAIVQGIIALARAFDRQTVAEGIETEEHYQVLLDMGCELGQGYGIARPMPADELPIFASKNSTICCGARSDRYRLDCKHCE